jgi:hypothetical protein
VGGGGGVGCGLPLVAEVIGLIGFSWRGGGGGMVRGRMGGW